VYGHEEKNIENPDTLSVKWGEGTKWHGDFKKRVWSKEGIRMESQAGVTVGGN